MRTIKRKTEAEINEEYRKIHLLHNRTFLEAIRKDISDYTNRSLLHPDLRAEITERYHILIAKLKRYEISQTLDNFHILTVAYENFLDSKKISAEFLEFRRKHSNK